MSISLTQLFAVLRPYEPTYLPPPVVSIFQKSKFSLLQIARYRVDIVERISLPIIRLSQNASKLLATLINYT